MKRRCVAGAVICTLFVLIVLAAIAVWEHVGSARDPGADPPWRVRLPPVAGIVIELPAATLLRAATSPLGRRLLDGRAFATAHGEFRFDRQGETLIGHCRRCQLRISELAAQTLTLAEATLHLRRDGDTLSGSLHAAGLRVDFSGRLADDSLALQWTLPPTAFAEALDLLRPAIPELARARLQGTVAARGTLLLPQRQASVEPVFEGLEVAGLGTEGLRFGAFSHLCRAADGSPQRRSSGEGSTDWLALDRLGKWLPRAVIAAEDAEFLRHPGVDLVELQRAQNGDGQGPNSRGASTLTQQLAKNFFTGAEPTLARKLRELLYVVEMERTLGKQRILTLYLNTVDWGPGICGAPAAAAHYFGKVPARLGLIQSAWLAGVLRNPHRAYRAEFLNARADEKRLRWVIDNMRLPAAVRRQAAGKLAFAAITARPSGSSPAPFAGGGGESLLVERQQIGAVTSPEVARNPDRSPENVPDLRRGDRLLE